MLSEGDTFGVFQLAESGMRGFTKDFKPSSIEDIATISALFRPGPLDNGMVSQILKVRRGEVEPSYPIKAIEHILKPTNGVLTYQEQVLAIARVVAGYSLSEADLLRRAIGKKLPVEMAAQKSKFTEGMVAAGYSKSLATELFEVIERFADYCLAYDTLIDTDEHGPLSIGYIVENKIKCHVRSVDSNGFVYSQPIEQWHNRGEKEVFRYDLEDGNFIEATVDHKFMTTNHEMLPIDYIFENGLDLLVIETSGGQSETIRQINH